MNSLDVGLSTVRKTKQKNNKYFENEFFVKLFFKEIKKRNLELFRTVPTSKTLNLS